MTSSPAPPRRYTVADLAAMPEDHAQRYEVIDGELFLNPSPLTKHQRIAGRLFRVLCDALTDVGHGEVFIAPYDVIFDDENCVQPDVLFVSAARASIVNEKNVRGAPDLCVEILSDGTRRKDLLRKRRLYERYGVSRYWVIDPETDRLEVYVHDGKAYASPAIHERGTVALEGLPALVRIDLAKLFA